jgi:hypothetical protein
MSPKGGIAVVQPLAFSADPESRAAFVTSNLGYLFSYTYPEMARRGQYRLSMAAYHAELDGKTGTLYTAAASARSVKGHDGRHRLRGAGDLHVYDVKPILRNELNRGAVLKPVATIPADACVANLLLSPDRKWLYFMDVKDRENVRLVRVETATRRLNQDLRLADGMEVLRLSPDGRKLVTSTSIGSRDEDRAPGARRYPGQVQVIDAASFTLEKTIALGRDVYDMDVGPGGRAYLSTPGAGGVIVLDLGTGAQLAEWGGIQGSSFLRVSRNGKRLYLMGQSPNQAFCWGLPDRPADGPQRGLPPPLGTPSGEMILTRDGKYLLFKSGALYELLGAT